MCYQPPVEFLGCVCHDVWKQKCTIRKSTSDVLLINCLFELTGYSLQSCGCVDTMDLQGVHSPLVSTLNSCISDVGAEELEKAGRRADEIMSMVQPSEFSEERRKQIIEYIQMIAEATYGIKVLPFGSVPLKTYLPEGDIDLTAISQLDNDVLVRVFLNLLECEYNSKAGFQVKNVKYIPAQVKIVRCSVNNISVDISFNQAAGLCTLGFLEQVAEIFGEDNLFRHGIILTKAWCFYESRTLGANFGLISTFALETMVAHVINLFHSSLHSPLAVLYKFLQYYSTFNWDMHCVAVNGLVLIPTLPEIVVQRPDDCDDLLITDDYLSSCREVYIRATGTSGNEEKLFCTKFLNVMDPLRKDNNLGKSVNRACFNRIKYAFSYGFETLRDTLMTPRENLNKGIDNFFRTVIANNAQSSSTKILVVSSKDTEPRSDDGIKLSIPKEGDCSSSGSSTGKISATYFPHIPQMTTLKINPARPSLSFHKAKEAVASLESSVSTSVNPSTPKKIEENQQSQSSPENHQEVVEPKPALPVDTIEFTSCPSHGQSSGIQNERSSFSARLSEKVTTGVSEGRGQGAWNKPLVWKQVEKGSEERKGTMKINPARPSLSSYIDKEVVASLESSVSTSVIPPLLIKVEENQKRQLSPKNHQEAVEAKPALLVDMKEFPSFPSHGQSSGVQNELPSSSSTVSEKVTGGSEGRDQIAWNKPLIWKQVEKGTEESKGTKKGAFKIKPARPSPISHKTKETVAVISPTPKKLEENHPCQSSPQNHREVIEAKPVLSIDMKEFPSFPSHGQSPGDQKDLPSLTSRLSKKNTGGTKGRGQGAWNKPLVWKMLQKD